MTEEFLKKSRKLYESYDIHDHSIDQNSISVLDKGFVRLIDHMGDDSSIVQAARVSYGKGTKTVNEDEGLIRYLMRNKHTTPFEMCTFKFHIKAPIFVFRQWHRHRTWSFNEVSGRYSELPDEFYVPEENKITKQNPNNKQGGTDELIETIAMGLTRAYATPEEVKSLFQFGQSEARDDYEIFLSSGMRKELARINLPLAQYSEMYASVDLHNLFHFLKLRLDDHAQYEIRVYAEAIAELIKSIVPISYAAFIEYSLNNTLYFQKDIEGLKKITTALISSQYDVDSLIEKTASELFSNKREKQEFIQKINKILK